jgi:hypothetical protein
VTTNHPDLTEALKALKDAEPDYLEAEHFYCGEVDEVLASQKLRELFGEEARKYRCNYARTPVDVLMERTKIQGWTCSNSAQLAAIEAAWEDNQLGIEAKDVHRGGYEFGDSYLIAWPEEDDPDFIGKVSAYCHDPKDVRVLYDQEKPRRKRLAIHRWEEAGADGNGLNIGEVWQRVNLYYPDRVERWVGDRPLINAAGSRTFFNDDATFVGYDGDDQDSTIYHDYGIPVFHFRTARPYGRPEHADAYGPQYGINKLYLSLMGAVDYAVLPQRYVATESEVDQASPADAFAEAVGDPLDPEYQSGLSDNSSMETGPGNVWLLSGKNVRPGQFDAADSANFTGPMAALIDQLYDVTDMPANRRHGQGGQQPSGDSQRMSEIPLNNKADDRHAQFGVTWHEWAQFVCDVNGLGETDAQVAWAPPEQYNDLASWQAATEQLAAGVPFEQVMRERGYPTQVVATWQAPSAAPVAGNLIPTTE